MNLTEQIARARRNTLADALRRAAIRHHGRPALMFGDRSWTFTALDLAVDRVARRFADRGLVPGDRVAAYGRNSDAYLIAFLACARAGLIHVPVNYALTGAELGYILEQSGARAVLSAPALEPNLEGMAVEIRGRFEGGGALDVLATALDEDAPTEIDVTMDDETICMARSSTVPPSCSAATGTSPWKRRRRSPADGSIPAMSAISTSRAISTSSIASAT